MSKPGDNPSASSDSAVLRMIADAAAAGARCPSNDEIAWAMGANSAGYAPGVIRRLEARGVIRVERFQRARRITIVETGMATAMPVQGKAVHWRDRPISIPTPAPHILREVRPDAAAQIEMMAADSGRPIVDVLCDLVWRGLQSGVDNSVRGHS